MKLVPLGDKVVLKQLEAEENNKSRYPFCRDRQKKTWRKQRLLP